MIRFASGKERGRSVIEEKVMMSTNFCASLIRSGEACGLGRVSTHDFSLEGGAEASLVTPSWKCSFI